MVAWILVPLLTGSVNTDIDMYFGNASPPAQPNSSSLYDANYIGVWPISESSTALKFQDVTAYNRHFVLGATTTKPTPGAAGLWNVAATFDGGDFASASVTNPYISGTMAATFEVWSKTSVTDAAYRWQMSIGAAAGSQARMMGQNGTTAYWAGYTNDESSAAAVTLSIWQHWVGVFDGAKVRLYRNGAQLSGPTTRAWNTANPGAGLQMGRGVGNSEYWNGSIGRMLIYSGTLDSARIMTEFKNQGSSSTFYAVGSTETFGDPNALSIVTGSVFYAQRPTVGIGGIANYSGLYVEDFTTATSESNAIRLEQVGKFNWNNDVSMYRTAVNELFVSGALYRKVNRYSVRTIVDNAYTASKRDSYLFFDTTADVLNAQLYTATSNDGYELAVKVVGANNLVVTPQGASTIDGAPSDTLAQWGTARYVVSGGNWYVF